MSMCYWCRRCAYCQAMEKEQYKAVNEGVMHCPSFLAPALPGISFGRTTPPFVNKEKTVTRRDWSQATIRKFRNDTYFLAWSKQQRFGGEAIGIGKITEDPFKQSTKMMNEMDYIYEGFRFLSIGYMDLAPLREAFKNWKNSDQILTVVPFEVLEVFPTMQEKYSTDEEIIKCVKALVRELP